MSKHFFSFKKYSDLCTAVLICLSSFGIDVLTSATSIFSVPFSGEVSRKEKRMFVAPNGEEVWCNVWKCVTCEKEFQNSTLVKRHFRVHTGARPFRCTMCEAAFARNDSLKCHLKTVHKCNI